MKVEERDDFDDMIGLTGVELVPTDDDYIPTELRGRAGPSWWKEGDDPRNVRKTLGF